MDFGESFTKLYLSVPAGLQQAFKPFGQVKVEWPGKEGKQNRHPPKGAYLNSYCVLSIS